MNKNNKIFFLMFSFSMTILESIWFVEELYGKNRLPFLVIYGGAIIFQTWCILFWTQQLRKENKGNNNDKQS